MDPYAFLEICEGISPSMFPRRPASLFSPVNLLFAFRVRVGDGTDDEWCRDESIWSPTLCRRELAFLAFALRDRVLAMRSFCSFR